MSALAPSTSRRLVCSGVLWAEFRSKDILRDAFIGIQSLLISFDLLTEHLATWLTTHLSFHNPWSQVECEQWRLLWIAFGLDAETAEHFAYDLQIQWCCASESLMVTKALSSLQPVAMVYNAVLALLRFITFTGSRWLTVGPSARTLFAALLTGFRSLVRFIEKHAGGELFFLRGFHRLEHAGVLPFMATVSFASRPSDAFIALLLEDPRVIPQLGALKETLDDEMQWLCLLPRRLWYRVGEAAGVPGQELRNASIHAALVSVAHIRESVIRVVESPPWSLAMGDVKANLAKLATKPEPPQI